MIRRCAYVIAAMASFSVNGAIGQEPAGANLQGNIADPASQITEQHLAAAKNPDLRQPPPGGNPLGESPLAHFPSRRNDHSFPRRAARLRPPHLGAAPLPVAEAPPPPAEPERPPLTLVGTAIGKPQNVALVLNQTTKSLTRLHVGEAASGWYLRSVDARTMTLEKNSQVVALSLPTPGAALVNPQPVAIAGRINRKF